MSLRQMEPNCKSNITTSTFIFNCFYFSPCNTPHMITWHVCSQWWWANGQLFYFLRKFCDPVNKIRTLDLRTEFFIALARQPHPYKCTLTLQLRQWSGPIEMLVSRIKHRLRVISGLDLLWSLWTLRQWILYDFVAESICSWQMIQLLEIGTKSG